MLEKKLFEAINKNVSKFEVRLENYIVPSSSLPGKLKAVDDQSESNHAASASKEIIIQNVRQKGISKTANLITEEESKNLKIQTKSQDKLKAETLKQIAEQEKNDVAERYAVFADKQEITQPKLCMWVYASEENVDLLLKLSNKKQIRETIDQIMEGEYPKGISRILAIEFMYSSVRFCQKNKFSVPQTGALLSIFYLTHQHFLSSFYTSVKKTYTFFKEYMLLHCFECTPDSIELFNYKESKSIVQYFCRLYLRNLPLIRLLTLPNFGFSLNYEKLPDPFEETLKGKGKKGKDKKKKKDKGKKKKDKKK